MKGATQVIGVVMAVIIAASIMVLSFRILGSANKGIDDIENTGKTQEQRLAGVQSVAQTCQDWTTGDTYKADAILNTYKLPDKMRPYDDVWKYCGEPLDEIAKKCFDVDKDRGECAGNGYISSGSTTISLCRKTCANIINIFNTCSASCPSKAGGCFETYLSTYATGRTISKSLDITPSLITKACQSG